MRPCRVALQNKVEIMIKDVLPEGFNTVYAFPYENLKRLSEAFFIPRTDAIALLAVSQPSSVCASLDDPIITIPANRSRLHFSNWEICWQLVEERKEQTLL
jgi:hypothetical protein